MNPGSLIPRKCEQISKHMQAKGKNDRIMVNRLGPGFNIFRKSVSTSGPKRATLTIVPEQRGRFRGQMH